MNLVLKRFSEDVDLNNPKQPQFFLVFDLNGEEFRLPTEASNIAVLMDKVFGKNKKAEAKAAPEPEEETEPEYEEPEVEGATEFGAHLADDIQEEEEETPSSEAEVPSL